MIQVETVTKYFGNKVAVNDVSFEVSKGDTLVLLGTSGSGKTTTLRMINRLIEADKGDIFISNQSIYSQPPETLRKNIGYVIQQVGLLPHYTIAENIAIVPKLLEWKKEDIQLRIYELLQMFRLPESVLTQHPSQLSGGQQQRVGLARALAADPPILLMDEPFGALDQLTRNAICKEFKMLAALKNKTIVLVTHDIQEAFELGDKIGIMDNGHIQQMGSSQELLLTPSHAFVTKFLSDHRLILEMKATKLKEFFPFESASSKLLDQTEEITADASLWDALQKIAAINHKKASFLKMKSDNTWYLVDTEKVWQKFYINNFLGSKEKK
ncbi:ATP-binding cassette domain-containing protein [Cytophagaceae bacterium DM2B3-1]|uniref:ATP-binding cassette domain-containing protein n=1 Tax=Xanthocytophaga flava TaxID=3048013 RepID=A0ABT7CRK2_9BACT|nr:ATP-binding cassette domain-containing protein [Xanthocytophaga flavus]MDJ1468601.1 ATP-binding cassette domain-containing protein [Xanthocytophaga flavus]MDJ1496381.1 ATP-binding cassette domain-containing protein [Xanthocytophaga flavus]